MAMSKEAWVKLVLDKDVEPVHAGHEHGHGHPHHGHGHHHEHEAARDGAAAAAPPAMAEPGSEHAEALAGAPGAEKIALAPVAPIVIGVLKTLFGELTANVSIKNDTQFTLTLDPASAKLKSGEYKSGSPAATIPPNGPASTFTVHSTPVKPTDIPVMGKLLELMDKVPVLNLLSGLIEKLLSPVLPDLNHCEGTIRYLVGDNTTAFTCYFTNPRNIFDPLGTNDAEAAVAGPNATGLKANQSVKHGNDGDFTFSLSGGGAGPTPNNGGDSGVALSCRVSVVNQTQQTVYLRKQDKVAGDYVTNPATSLAPGAKTDFVFAETPNSKDHGCRGLMTWEVGDPKQAKWDLMWDNQKGAKNLSASFLDPKDGPFHTLDQIDDGDENVPATFTLSGGGGGGPVPNADKPTNSVVNIANNTAFALNLVNQVAHAGKFTAPPPKSIPAGGTAKVTFAGPDDPKQIESGEIEWQVGPDKGSTWRISWLNPRGQDNQADSEVQPAMDGVTESADAGSGDQDVDFSFTLAGKSGPGPQPGKEPTSCAIMVSNNTKQVLTLAGQTADQGSFKKAPPKSLAAGASALVTFVGPKDDPSQGAKGSMVWNVGSPPVTVWTLEWENPPGEGNSATDHVDPTVPGITTTSSVGQGDDDVAFTYAIAGDSPQPQQQGTSCKITVRNDTQSALTLTQQTAESGSFDGNPPGSIAAGASAQFGFKGASDGPKPGAAGSVVWQVGDDAAATCTMHWTNPPGPGNTADIKLAPDDKSMSTSATAGDGDEDVPFAYAIAAKAGPGPVEPGFLPPPKSKQPTLRKGDKSPDGWVEYAQGLLNHYGATLKVDGDFGAGTDAAVRAFQTKHKAEIVDGVIGNETWSLLRNGPKEEPSTDGRTPHTFEQKDAQARFATEDSQFAGYSRKDDSFFMLVMSPGEQPIDDFKITVQVTQPDKTSHTESMKIGSDINKSPDGQGNAYRVKLRNFKKLFKLGAAVDPVACMLDAYLDGAIGGDRWTGNPVDMG